MIRPRLRRLWLEIRRNEYRWLFPLIAAGTGLALTARVEGPVVFWTDATLAWRDSLLLLGPWTAAAAAWTAGRERRAGLDDLLATTAASAFRRRVWAYAGVIVLALAAYALIGAWLLGVSAPKAAWSGPDWGVAGVGIVVLTGFGAIGFALGAWKPRRATAFATLIGLVILMLFLVESGGALGFLSPAPKVGRSPWTGLAPSLSGDQAVFFLALTGLGMTAIAAISNRGRVVRGAISGAVLLTLMAAGAITTQDGSIRRATKAAAGIEAGAPAPGTYEPVCSNDPVPVCMHPAFEPMLAATARDFERLVSISGDTGTVRIDLIPVIPAAQQSGVASHLLRSGSIDEDLTRAAHAVATDLLGSAGDPELTNATIVAAISLAGRPVECSGTAATSAGIAWTPVDCSAVARLVALPDAELQAWLSAHLSKIRSGNLTREELP